VSVPIDLLCAAVFTIIAFSVCFNHKQKQPGTLAVAILLALFFLLFAVMQHRKETILVQTRVEMSTRVSF
jgi:uncharacterized membrane protein YqjE